MKRAVAATVCVLIATLATVSLAVEPVGARPPIWVTVSGAAYEFGFVSARCEGDQALLSQAKSFRWTQPVISDDVNALWSRLTTAPTAKLQFGGFDEKNTKTVGIGVTLLDEKGKEIGQASSPEMPVGFNRLQVTVGDGWGMETRHHYTNPRHGNGVRRVNDPEGHRVADASVHYGISPLDPAVRNRFESDSKGKPFFQVDSSSGFVGKVYYGEPSTYLAGEGRRRFLHYEFRLSGYLVKGAWMLGVGGNVHVQGGEDEDELWVAKHGVEMVKAVMNTANSVTLVSVGSAGVVTNAATTTGTTPAPVSFPGGKLSLPASTGAGADVSIPDLKAPDVSANAGVTVVEGHDGVVGGACAFSGTTSLQLVEGKGRILGGPITADFWLRTTAAGGWLFEVGAANRAPNVDQRGYGACIESGHLRFTVNQHTGQSAWDDQSWDDATSSTPVNDGRWHHVVLLFPADGKSRIQITLDGRVDAPSRRGRALPAFTGFTVTPTLVGRNNVENSFFAGAVDDFTLCACPPSAIPPGGSPQDLKSIGGK